MTTTLSDKALHGGDFFIDHTASRFGFVARHVLVNRVRGHFKEFWGKAHLDLERPANSWVKVDIEAASLTTHNRRRDDHLRSSDFLDVGAHPLISYRSLRVSRISDTSFKVVGDLTIRGATRVVPLFFEYAGTMTDSEGRMRLNFHSSAVVSRRHWGITWNETLDRGGVAVGDRVALELDVSVVQPVSEAQPTARALPATA